MDDKHIKKVAIYYRLGTPQPVPYDFLRNEEIKVKEISTEELFSMKDKAGLVIQQIYGDPRIWAGAINSRLTELSILQNESFFRNVSVFEHRLSKNLLLHIDGEDLDLNLDRLIASCVRMSPFGCIMLNDYITKNIGVSMKAEALQKQKPDCPLIGQNGNIFNLMAIASRTLKENGLGEQAQEMRERIMSSGSYNIALCILGEYVNITSVEETQAESGNFDMEQSY